MKKVAGSLRIDLAQYRELEAFAQFGSDLDKTTQAQLARGERLVEVLKQPEFAPITTSKQIVIIFAATNGYLDQVPVDAVGRYEEELYLHMDSKASDVLEALQSQNLDDALREKLGTAVKEFTDHFHKRQGDVSKES